MEHRIWLNFHQRHSWNCVTFDLFFMNFIHDLWFSTLNLSEAPVLCEQMAATGSFPFHSGVKQPLTFHSRASTCATSIQVGQVSPACVFVWHSPSCGHGITAGCPLPTSQLCRLLSFESLERVHMLVTRSSLLKCEITPCRCFGCCLAIPVEKRSLSSISERLVSEHPISILCDEGDHSVKAEKSYIILKHVNCKRKVASSILMEAFNVDFAHQAKWPSAGIHSDTGRIEWSLLPPCMAPSIQGWLKR